MNTVISENNAAGEGRSEEQNVLGDHEVGEEGSEEQSEAKGDSEKESEAKGDSLKRTLYWVGGLGISLTAGAFLIYASSFDGGISSEPGRWAEFGDFFGGTLNPILSLLGLLALLYTIYLQNEALNSSREELALTREEFKQSNDTAKKQFSHLTTRAKLDDLMRIVEYLTKKVSEDFESLLIKGDERNAMFTQTDKCVIWDSFGDELMFLVKDLEFLVQCCEEYKKNQDLEDIKSSHTITYFGRKNYKVWCQILARLPHQQDLGDYSSCISKLKAFFDQYQNPYLVEHPYSKLVY